MTLIAALETLERALQPLVDASLRHRELEAFARSAAEAFESVRSAAQSAAPTPILPLAPPRLSARMARALALVEAGTHTPLEAAKANDIAASTVYRALAKKRRLTEAAQAPKDS